MTEEIPTDLQVLGEIAIGLAGFMGIVSALRSRREGGLSDRERFHMVTLLLSTVFILFMSFVPSVLSLLPGSENQVWAWSIRVLFGSHLLAWAFSIPLHKRGRLVLRELPVVERNLGLLFAVLGAMAMPVELALVLGYFEGLIPFTYVIVVVLFLSFGIYNFFSLLLGPRD